MTSEGGEPVSIYSKPHGVDSCLLDRFFNSVAAFGGVNIDGTSMLYAGFVEHSKFDSL